jgi:hypothetical protein
MVRVRSQTLVWTLSAVVIAIPSAIAAPYVPLTLGLYPIILPVADKYHTLLFSMPMDSDYDVLVARDPGRLLQSMKDKAKNVISKVIPPFKHHHHHNKLNQPGAPGAVGQDSGASPGADLGNAAMGAAGIEGQPSIPGMQGSAPQGQAMRRRGNYYSSFRRELDDLEGVSERSL